MELKLWAAVLAQAFHDLCMKDGSKDSTRIKGSAFHWFFRSKADGIGSLNWICSALEIDSEFVRKRALSLLHGAE